MPVKATTLAALLLCAAARGTCAQVDGQTIYGNDDRVDLCQVKSEAVLKLADSTVALFDSSDVTVKAGQARLSLTPYGQEENLCPGERFRDQLEGAFCSGSLVAPDVVMTAGHCVTSREDCAGTKFVFGFSIMEKSEGTPRAVPAGEVYGCKELIGRAQDDHGPDWALVRLDRKVFGHQPLALDTAGGVAKGTPLFVIGHPSGLPTKVAGGARVRDASPRGYFVASLDTYGGNSGSAVFNAGTGLVEGILVRGDTDFVPKGRCRVSYRVPDDGGRGEDVTKISSVLPHLPRVETFAFRAIPLARTLPAASFDGAK